MNSGLPYTIFKPCGLTNDPPGGATLATFHNDRNKTICCGKGIVARSDIARVISAALHYPELSGRLRFNFCSYKGAPPTTDAGLLDVLKTAMYPWEREP